MGVLKVANPNSQEHLALNKHVKTTLGLTGHVY